MKKILVATIFSFFTVVVFAQDRAAMERERQQLQKEINAIQGDYSKVKKQKQATLAQLNVLLRKMDLQDRYIGNINKELNIISSDIYTKTLEINHLQRELDTLKAQYARSVVYAYKNRSTYDYLNFIFSANSFNDALKRIAYLKKYRQYREQQAREIVETQKRITDNKQQLVGKKQEKNVVLKNQEKQLAVLEDQKKEKDVVVAQLKSKEKELNKQLSVKKKRDNELKNAIAAMIRREIEAARKRAAAEAAAKAKDNASTSTATTGTTKKTTTTSKSYSVFNTEKDVALSANFSNNRGRLPWPVDNGVVCIHYGTYSVPGTNVKGDNPGITICTPSSGASVKAVFDGEVTAVTNEGEGMTVMIRHGKYFTIYSNLSSSNVGRGDVVRTGQAIGRTAEDDDGNGGKLEFLMMQEYTKLNPEPWLRR
jgi:septal ring factor EnvC (AmiA/AmiB activator)